MSPLFSNADIEARGTDRVNRSISATDADRRAVGFGTCPVCDDGTSSDSYEDEGAIGRGA
jgi:hypothetical protein